MVFFIGSTIFMLGLNLAELLYPGYSVSQNYISDLGATCRSGICNIVQPSAIIFNSSIILTGICVLIGSYILSSKFKSRFLSIFMAFSGIGAICVGIFPEYTGNIHRFAALITFIFGGFSPIAAFRLLKSPISYLSIALGALSLAAIPLYISRQYMGLGQGGMERMIVYPFVLWLLGFGGYLMCGQSLEGRTK